MRSVTIRQKADGFYVAIQLEDKTIPQTLLAVSQKVTGISEATGTKNRDTSEALASEPTNPLQLSLFEWMNGQVIGC